MSMANSTAGVIGGVDTHKHTNHAAVIDLNGQLLGDREFLADARGHDVLLAWIKSYGEVQAIGIEGTGFYGAALAQSLTRAGEHVVEVNRANRAARRADGKSDRLDAEHAARSVLAMTARAVPKSKAGAIEVIRMLRVARSSAVKARTQAFNALHGIVIGAPSPFRDELVKLTKRSLVNRCLRLRPEVEDLGELTQDVDRLLVAGAKVALRDLARRWVVLDMEVKALSKQIKVLVDHAAPQLVSLFGVGTELAGQFLVTAGDNSGRIRNEAAFAKLCGAAPQPASSGKTTGRHRLSRGGDRAGKQRPLHRGHHPIATPSTQSGVLRAADSGGAQQTRSHSLSEALHRA
jgi:transposase